MHHPALVATRRYVKKSLIQTGLEASLYMAELASKSFLANVGGQKLISNAAGSGAIFTMHRVEPTIQKDFQPNAHLTITPDFLDATISSMKQRGYVGVALKDLPAYVEDKHAAQKPSAMVFTLDDGYRNNLEYALPVFQKHNVPFTIFACSGYIDRTHSPWWEVAERLVDVSDEIAYDFGTVARALSAKTITQKYAAFDRMAKDVMAHDQIQAEKEITRLAQLQNIEPLDIAHELFLNEDEVRQLAQEPLADIGAHTISHANLANVSDRELAFELTESRDHIAKLTGVTPSTFAFPYGCRCVCNEREFDAARQAGFDLSVTTRPGTIDDDSLRQPHQLKRISLNGYYQKPHYVSALASGIPFLI